MQAGYEYGRRAGFGKAPQDLGDGFAERRAVPRYLLKAEIKVFEPLQGIQLTAQVSQIGLNGCHIQMATPLRQNTIIQIIIKKDEESFKSCDLPPVFGPVIS